MRIGLLGTGHIGKTIARTLSAAGHEVKVANSRGPETIAADVLANGARAVTAEEALTDVDVAILSIPPTGFAAVASLVAALPDDVVVIDTSNYYPQRDGEIAAIERGQVEAEWVQQTLGHPIAKAWNAIGSDSFAMKGQAKGHPDRVAIPVAADRPGDRDVALALVDDSGFDGFDAGSIADAWRQQPGAPAYCTDLASDQMGAALASAERHRLARRRDIAVAAIAERMGDGTTNPDADFSVRLNRAIYM